MNEASRPYRELTLSAVVFGTLLGVLMTAAFVYSGLKLGFTIGGSTIAAILGFAFLRGVLRRGTIVENNINQTVASAVNVSAAGIIFTVPSLLLMGHGFSPVAVTAVAVAGSVLGIVVISPLRRRMIEVERLRFPSGVAVAAVLRSPGSGREQVVILASGCALSVAVVVLVKAGLVPQDLPLGRWFGLPVYMNTSLSLSLMNIGAGMLAGRGGLPFMIGGMAAYWVIAPAAVASGWVAPEGVPGNALFAGILRPLGIGILVGSALAGVALSLPALRGAVGRVGPLKRQGGGPRGGGRDGMGTASLALLFAASLAVIFAVLLWQGSGVAVAAILTAAGALWIVIAGIIVARCTGLTDISPISGLSFIGIALAIFITGGDVGAAVLVGAAVSVASGQCADMMQDLKTGYLVGSLPRRQQVVQLLSAWIGPVVAMAVMLLLWKGSGVGPGFGPESAACRAGSSECLSAPQADALRVVLQGLVRGDMPLDRYAAGGVIGAVVSLLPGGGPGVLVGLAMYLPFPVTMGFGAGCLVTMAITAVMGRGFSEERGVPWAAGLIIGEAMAEIVYSLYMIL
ncbi:MAG: OPT/YSL family transporter [Spirochaetes bacterium]|nr:OPT/YSL family transporter [Spirochaetota bacterium]